MATALVLIGVVGVVIGYAVVRTVSERRAQERAGAALDVLARVRRYRVDMSSEQLLHDHPEQGHQQDSEGGADGFHVRVLGTSGSDDPSATPRPVPVNAIPAKTRLWATSRAAISPRAGDNADRADPEPDNPSVPVEQRDADNGCEQPPLLQLGSFGDGDAVDPGELKPPPTPARPDTGHRSRPVGLTRRAILAAAACLVIVTIAASAFDFGDRAGREAPTTATNPRTTTETAAPTTTEPSGPPPAPVLVRSDVDGAEYRLTGGFGVEIHATDTLYVRVDDADGTTLFEAILEPGQEHPVLSTGPIRVRVGNASNAQILINATPIPLPATSSPYNIDLHTQRS